MEQFSVCAAQPLVLVKGGATSEQSDATPVPGAGLPAGPALPLVTGRVYGGAQPESDQGCNGHGHPRVGA